jgi:lipopolysaccharide heptosyltransferase II
MSPSAPLPPQTRRILCVRLDGMGDLVMTAPAIAALKAAWPDAVIGLLASPTGAAAAHCMPFIDELYVFRAPWMKHGTPADSRECAALIERLRDARFDAAVIFTVSTQDPLPAALLCYLAGIPNRCAYSAAKPYALLSHRLPEPEQRHAGCHEVQRQLALVAQLGAAGAQPCAKMVADAAAHAWAHAELAQRALIGQRRWVALHPGATASSRRYPPDAWAAVIRQLGRRGVAVLVIGGRADNGEVAAINDALPPGQRALLPEIDDVGRLVALLSRVPALLCNNSGPSHVASCLDVPVVCLYALTNPQHRPWGRINVSLSHAVECEGCLSSICPRGRNACIADVAPADVVAATLGVLARAGMTADIGCASPVVLDDA